MKEKTIIQLIMSALINARAKYLTNASGEQLFDFQRSAKKHYDEYTEAIEWFHKLVERKEE